jgi:hypothetical protein
MLTLVDANQPIVARKRPAPPPAEDRDEMLLNTKILEQAGRLLVGENWQCALARLLAPYRPDQSASPLDDSLVRKWKRGARPIPEWVQDALSDLLKKRVPELEEMAREAESLSKQLASRKV